MNTRTEALVVPAIKARISRRSAIGGTAAAALGLAAGVGSASAQVQPGNSALVDLARTIPALVARCDAIADEVAAAEDAISFDATPEAEVVEVERLGLPVLRARQDRAEARLDRAAARLGSMSARTSVEIAAKAAAVVSLLGNDAITRGFALERHSGLVASALRDAATLGASV